jgi:putative glutamine amidotransferase
MSKKIGITKCDSSFENYPNWIKDSKESVEIIELDYKIGNIEDIKKCDGVIFSGGVDVHPRFYNSEKLNYKNHDGKFNEKRDEFEKKVFWLAQEKQIPILGICRGMQYINVLMGGGLIQDLEEDGKNNHRNIEDKDENGKKMDSSHEIHVDKNSFFYEVTKAEKGKVNSAHHQGLGKIAPELKVTAVSEDDVAEALEYKDKTNKPFFLCVQWHPERLKIEETRQCFSSNLREAFLNSIK